MCSAEVLTHISLPVAEQLQGRTNLEHSLVSDTHNTCPPRVLCAHVLHFSGVLARFARCSSPTPFVLVSRATRKRLCLLYASFYTANFVISMDFSFVGSSKSLKRKATGEAEYATSCPFRG